MFQIEQLVPAVLGGTLGILAIIGIFEFLKESTIAFKKSSHP